MKKIYFFIKQANLTPPLLLLFIATPVWFLILVFLGFTTRQFELMERYWLETDDVNFFLTSFFGYIFIALPIIISFIWIFFTARKFNNKYIKYTLKSSAFALLILLLFFILLMTWFTGAVGP